MRPSIHILWISQAMLAAEVWAPELWRSQGQAAWAFYQEQWPGACGQGFFNKIQNEASQPYGLGAPQTPYQLRIPVSTSYYGIAGNHGDSDHEKERHEPITNTIKGTKNLLVITLKR